MEMKDMLLVAISAVTACVGLLSYRLNAKVRTDTLRLRHQSTQLNEQPYQDDASSA